jgi:hypothetical protein
MSQATPTLAEARERVALLSANLPTAVDPLAISTIAKTPYTALCFRESQAWRMEEFARAACDMFERGDLVVAVSNARHATECCAAVYYLMKLIESSIESGIVADLTEKIVRLQVGFKNNFAADMPEAINVLTMIKKVDKDFPGFLRSYEDMSEIAHPNWAGSAAVFSQSDASTLITHFRRGIRDTESSLNLGLLCLTGSLEIFFFAYNRLGDLTPAFVEVCEKEIASNKNASPPAD